MIYETPGTKGMLWHFSDIEEIDLEIQTLKQSQKVESLRKLSYILDVWL